MTQKLLNEAYISVTVLIKKQSYFILEPPCDSNWLKTNAELYFLAQWLNNVSVCDL